MSRRRCAEKREILPDPKFGDVTLSKFINCLMYDGKRAVAEGIVYGAISILEEKGGNDNRHTSSEDEGEGEAGGSGGDFVSMKSVGLRTFHDALSKVKPHLEVRSRRVGGATYQVPVEVRSTRALALAIRWLIDASRKRSETTMVQRLAREIEDAAQGRGSAVKKRDDTHKMAEANKAFAHYRW